MASKESQSLDESSVKVGVVPDGYTAETEGAATILFKKEGGSEVFYNEVQIKNRDLSTLVLNEFAMQLEREAEYQIDAKLQGKSWRKIPPSWETWGMPKLPEEKFIPHKNKAEKKKDEEPETSEDLKKKGYIGMSILEALAASGLRSFRYLKEVVEGVGIDTIVVNDLEPHAVKCIKRNAIFNGLDADPRLEITQGDATLLMYKHRINPDSKADCTRSLGISRKTSFDRKEGTFDVIDLDPYGSPSIFIDSAVQSISDGGLLCITATDLPTMCGKNPENCFARYQAMPLKVGNFPHEMAIRMLLGSIEQRANVYGRHIVPLMSVHMDFYIRVFVRVYSDKNEIKLASTKLANVLYSRGCPTFFLQRLGERKSNSTDKHHAVRPVSWQAPQKCPETDQNLALGGPIWAEPMHNPAFVQSILGHFSKPCPNGFDASKLGRAKLVEGVVQAVSDELIDVPLFYSLPSMCKLLHLTCPPLMTIQSALANAGYRVSQPHSDPNGLKTDAPSEVMWDILRAWAKKKPPSDKHNDDEKVKAILSKTPTIQVDFTTNAKIRSKFREKNAKSRYHPNPKANWGPKAAAKGSSSRQTHKRSGQKHNPGTRGDEGPAKKSKMDLFNL